ncbi:hypothetical protein GCM10008985_03960 [Halococcus dombrowskii]|uniref:Uncharacterized protein n=2 Tax=Halococcus dombrowskii TaxID=179637 RepID=A0AAV3SDH8_HALDO
MSETQSATAPEAEAETEDRTEPEAAADTGSIPREQQMVFGDDGEIEPNGDAVETSLEAFGAEVDHSEGSGRVVKPSATRFGIDDRAQTSQRTESDQRSLFADVESGQQTLGGDDAATRCLFGDEGGDNGGEET